MSAHWESLRRRKIVPEWCREILTNPTPEPKEGQAELFGPELRPLPTIGAKAPPLEVLLRDPAALPERHPLTVHLSSDERARLERYARALKVDVDQAIRFLVATIPTR